MARRTQHKKPMRSGCPVSAALELFGDKWTLIVIRDLAVGKRRYSDFQRSPEKIPTNILADRLRQLERLGVIDKRPYQRRPPRYAYGLTAKGADLLPVLQALARWSGAHVEGVWQAPTEFFELTPDALRNDKQDERG